MQFPPSPILTVKFLNEGKQIVVSMACGILIFLDICSTKIIKLIVLKEAVGDQIKLISDNLIVVGGLAGRIRIYNLENDKIIGKFMPHKGGTAICHMNVLNN